MSIPELSGFPHRRRVIRVTRGADASPLCHHSVKDQGKKNELRLCHFACIVAVANRLEKRAGPAGRVGFRD